MFSNHMVISATVWQLRLTSVLCLQQLWANSAAHLHVMTLLVAPYYGGSFSC
jgi:hypothetical protein